MSDGGCAGTSSAAMRRRERRLRAALASRAAQRQDGPDCSPAPLRSEVCCWARDARSPTGTDDSQGSGRCAALLSRKQLPPGAPGLTGSRRSGRRSGSSGTPWIRSSPHRCSMFLCRRWRNSCFWTSLGHMIVRFPNWFEPQTAEQLVEVPTVLSVAVLQQGTVAAWRRSCSLSRHSFARLRNGPDSGSSLAPLPGRGGGSGRRGGRGRFLKALFFVVSLVVALFVLGNLDIFFPLVSGSRRCLSSTGMLSYFFYAPRIWQVCLARQWIHFYVSLQRLLGYFTQVVREGGLGPCGPPGLLYLSLCNDRCP